jgi:hypothetical protein
MATMIPRLLVVLSLVSPTFDDGRFENVDPETRDWFRSVRAPSGIPCCDMADGHRTTYETRGAEFWVPIPSDDGTPVMTRVPLEAIVLHARNPTGDAVVWWVKYAEGTFIRCFVLPEMI